MTLENGMDEKYVGELIRYHEYNDDCPCVSDVVHWADFEPEDFICLIEAIVAHYMGYN